MRLKEYRAASATKIPLKALRFLVQCGVLSDPLAAGDQEFLERLERIWGNADLLRVQMAPMGRVRRENLTQTADLSDRWQRHLQTTFYNLGIQGRKISTRKVVLENANRFPSLARLLGENPDFVMEEAKRIRRRAAGLRAKAKRRVGGGGEKS